MNTISHPLAGFPPKVFLIGAQKAGTTFLANLLNQHPGIVLASPKEPHYFTQYRHHDIDWYRRCFSDEANSKLLLDASPSYSAAPTATRASDINEWHEDNPYIGAPGRIEEVSPHARFIYLVRDPVARIHSGYWHAVRAGAEPRPFREAIAADSRYRRISDYLAQLNLYLQRFSQTGY